MEYVIPRRTQEMLLAEHPEGTRHHAKLKIAIPLLGEGLPPEAVVATLREKFPQASDTEIRNVVRWSVDTHPTPSGHRNGHKPRYAPTPAKITPKQAVSGFIGTASPAIESVVQIPPTGQAELLFRSLYSADEYINIVCKFTLSETKGKVKANPSGSGSTRKRDEWIDFFSKKGEPFSEAGAWVRPNPVTAKGSGHEGAVTNADVTAFRVLLLESDELSMDEQLAVYERLKLPLVAILTSGGKSCHGWLRIDATDVEEYAEKAEKILAALLPFGFDPANKNPSRLSRLPGVERKIGGNGKQELLYLNPQASGITAEEITLLELRTKPQRFTSKPMREAVVGAMELYDDICKHKHQRGLLTGFPIFDSITGGLKRGWLTIVAGETGAGKTTYVLNIVMNALRQKKAVALFSFEMDQQEILDMIFSREAAVNRNKFNNGYFSNADFAHMTSQLGTLSAFQLFTFDDPLMTIQDVFEASERLAIENTLDLVVIDYLQLANSDEFKDSREQQVARISRRSKALAKKLKVPVIGVSQVNDTGKVRESRGIAHDANCVIMVSEDDNQQIEAKVVKGRSIPKGAYYFQFEREECRLTEIKADERLMSLVPKEPEK